jgi:hypothetical protein
VPQDSSDWNICATCYPVLQRYLSGAPSPTGVQRTTVPPASRSLRRWWKFPLVK